ncbi:hypothetical protein BCV69DRAFT_279650 [Microstroma glucosiphilum]|uniref:Thioesterase domain-containing protein n=1 Tax=Pseudomicrostroma glucosiphilum TaxID=1684307 RepID=A0A316UER0_9BASI|nr:hypothetical protein BCV69DRAFT_279650 [Pseudomicrostroma glucosiphilum]PWN23726.1 hypothetical protein BCV69DRAFT_279650 [Pseudomicrostroma glucosiphilum]
MPAPKPPLPLEDAKVLANDLLSTLPSASYPGFSRHATSPTVKLISAERLDKNGKEASPEDVQKSKFHGRMVFRMKAEQYMMNEIGSMHGGCVATLVDNLTSVAIYLHIADTEPTTPWAFLGVTSSLSVVYLAAVPLDSWFEVECSVLSIGSRIAVITADFWLLEGPEGGRVKKTAVGTHTKVDNSFANKL